MPEFCKTMWQSICLNSKKILEFVENSLSLCHEIVNTKDCNVANDVGYLASVI